MMRRGFLAMLGLGPIASLVAEEPVSKLSYHNPLPLVNSNIVEQDESSYLKKMLKEMSSKEDWIKDWIDRQKSDMYNDLHIDRVDPDIRAMKSFSDSAKVRMQWRRMAERRYDQDRNRCIEQLKRLVA